VIVVADTKKMILLSMILPILPNRSKESAISLSKRD
jgi:hypothetical protein